jgi:hypothetical protein
MLFAENFFISGKNIIFPENFFGISGKILLYLGINVLYPENFFDVSGKFSEMTSPPTPSPPSPTFPGKNI